MDRYKWGIKILNLLCGIKCKLKIIKIKPEVALISGENRSNAADINAELNICVCVCVLFKFVVYLFISLFNFYNHIK